MKIIGYESEVLLDQLRELGEWAALGFYEALAEELPWPRPYGRAYRRLYENQRVLPSSSHLLIPSEPLENARTERTHQVHHAESLVVDFMHDSGLHVNRCILEEKLETFPAHADLLGALAEDMETRLPHCGGYTHTNPDIRRVVSQGFDRMEADLDNELASLRAEGEEGPELHFLLSLKDYCIGVRAWHGEAVLAAQRAAEGVAGQRGEDLAQVRDAMAGAFLKPASSFLEGLLGVHMTWLLDGCDSIGRVDQVLGSLFEADLTSGRLSLAFVRRLIDDFFLLFEELNGWNLTVGGRTPEGEDGCNLLTEEILRACIRNRLRRPNVAFRINGDTPQPLLDLALQGLAQGSGRPALYNDDLYTQSLLRADLGLTPEDARDHCFGGCTETMIGGLSNVGSLDGTINLAVCLERALFNGENAQRPDPKAPRTGMLTEFADYDEFEAALKEQILHATRSYVEAMNGQLRRRFGEGDPKPYRSFFTRDCVRNHRSFEAAGARYNASIATYQGTANLIDSLEVIERLVFGEGAVAADTLLEALRNDFVGHEALRGRLLSQSKFGNDCERVDLRGAAILRFAWEALRSHEPPRGGRHLPACILFVTYADAGAPIGATPDGRRAGTPLNDSIGATPGRDREGPTALLRSVTRLPLELAIGTPVLNLRFQRAVIDSDPGRRGIAALLKQYFAAGGLQMQVSVIDREELLAAQESPEEHGHLIVRIGGYSEFFTRLSPALQASVIARTEHGV
ncbi:MAG: pyruvate formate lyase family protein [Planctomycetota bacterium]